MTTQFDITTVRNKFAGLKRSQVYLDNAGGSQTLTDVSAAIYKYLTNTNVQLGATYAVGRQATASYVAGYEAAAKYINAMPAEIVMGPSTTQLFRNLSQAFSFPAGSEIIISAIDHEANIASWLALARSQNLCIKWWLPSPLPSPPTFTTNPALNTNPKLDSSGLEKLMSEKTKLVTCTHASNILGTIHDVKSIAATVHKVPGAMLVIDAVAYAPHREIDVKELGVDFYAFSWYKVYGPHISMLYGRKEVHEQLNTLGHYFNPQVTMEEKLGLAASNYELTASIPCVLSYFGSEKPQRAASFAVISAHEEKLSETLLSYLRGRNDVIIYGERVSDRKLRVSTISFTIKGITSREVVERVEKNSDFGFRWGCMYSNRLVEETLGLGKDGVVRVSMVHYNTVTEVEAFLKVLEEVVPETKLRSC